MPVKLEGFFCLNREPGIRDPPRPDVPNAIEVIRRAGVRIFMVTGDFKLTAIAIAQQVSCQWENTMAFSVLMA
jgi:magnesium-transporting ATPase (P-type)